MTALDWAVLLGSTLFIVGYGLWRTRQATTTAEYLRGGYDQPWPTIGLSVMAIQASAITFFSVPGQAYEDGMRFVQFYFGLPLAMILISVFVIPIYFRLKVYTAYEFLENRFDLKTRLLGASLFLVQRGLTAGITLYAPAIILSAILGWPLEPTIWAIGFGVIVYTVTGGSSAVSQTQKQQMIVMLGGMAVAAGVVIWRLPSHVTFGGAVDVAGALGRMKVISFDLDVKDRYNVWSGLTGGLFLALAYFGTDQSQVGRYLTARSIAQSRLGLLFNGVLKIPMQFGILFIGVLVFAFYQFIPPPLVFNGPLQRQVEATAMSSSSSELNALGSTTTIDLYRRLLKPGASDRHLLRAAKAFTVLWGLIAVGFASFASLLDNLIQAVNILGSIFYGSVLGIFRVAFFLKKVGGHAVFAAAVVSQLTVIGLFFRTDIGFLWYNVIGCGLVTVLALILQGFMGPRRAAA